MPHFTCPWLTEFAVRRWPGPGSPEEEEAAAVSAGMRGVAVLAPPSCVFLTRLMGLQTIKAGKLFS